MIQRTAPTYNVEIHMAGDINAAALFIQQVAAKKGLCVTISPQSYIYSGGREEGFRIGFINYPRFPSEPSEIFKQAYYLADWVADHIGQHSYSIVTPSETYWYSEREEERKPFGYGLPEVDHEILD